MTCFSHCVTGLTQPDLRYRSGQIARPASQPGAEQVIQKNETKLLRLLGVTGEHVDKRPC